MLVVEVHVVVVVAVVAGVVVKYFVVASVA